MVNKKRKCGRKFISSHLAFTPVVQIMPVCNNAYDNINSFLKHELLSMMETDFFASFSVHHTDKREYRYQEEI